MLNNTGHTDLTDWLALNRAPSLSARQQEKVFAFAPSLSTLFRAKPADWLAAGLSPSLRNYLAQPDWAGVKRDLAWLQQDQHHIITRNDPNYPSLLRQISDPPLLLYVWGHLDCLAKHQIAMVGSRHPSHSGQETARVFAKRLAAQGYGITSGLAKGIDGASHCGCLEGDGQTIAVLGSGLAQIYPYQHRQLAARIAENGAVVSEYPPETKPLAGYFPARNRIISGLSLGVWVVEATPRSGSLITARLAAEQGREVFAMPGSIHNPLARGCHHLLRQGAKLVETCEDIIEELGPLSQIVEQAALQKNPHFALADEDVKLVECVGFEPTPIDLIIDRSKMPAEQVLAKLAEFELHGLVVASTIGYERQAGV